jgi:succinate dehydrogenase/fumarate reductase flavoprotein subunit
LGKKGDTLTEQINYGSVPAKWPYPVKYGVENAIETDVLVIGAGVAGAMAGLAAARRGVKVAVVDKAPVEISGSGGNGLDHYLNCYSNPDCAISVEEVISAESKEGLMNPGNDHRTYIQMRGSWENLLELEKLGLHFRDEEDEFKGAPFRDEKTKIMYAYDYKTKHSIRLRGGAKFKKVIKDGLLKEKNVTLFERVMATSLLSEGGKPGARVVGATGFSEETGEFYVFSAKSVIVSTAGVSMQGTQTWTFNSEMFGNGYRADPRNTGDGVAMLWKAGAEFVSEASFGQTLFTGPFGWPWYGVGNPDNTWHPCTLVDNKGTVIPWVDSRGDSIDVDDMAKRTLPAKGESQMTFPRPTPYIDPEKIRSGEYELPLWADLSSMPEHERRAIWGLMVGNEGKTRYAIYDNYNKQGFNPDTDMLQCPVMSPESFGYPFKDWFQGEPNNSKFWKADTLKGVASDWDQMTSVEGLFAAGSETNQGGSAAGSSGSYAGNRAAEYAKRVSRGRADAARISAEKERVYAPVKRLGDPDANVSWKEIWMGVNRVMQQDCGDIKNAALSSHGLMWLDSIKRHEMRMTYARNPHELARVMEAESRATVAEIYLHLCLANLRADGGNAGADKLMFCKFAGGELVTTFRENGWWLKPPYAATYSENYERRRALEKEGKTDE